MRGLSLPWQGRADRVRGAAVLEPLQRGAAGLAILVMASRGVEDAVEEVAEPPAAGATERLARRMDAADQEFMEAMKPLQGLYRALVTAHGAHRDVKAQRGEGMQELSMEL